jgi:hypothetical protein
MLDNPTKVQEAVERLYFWKFSKIDGDPTLGKGVKCYATRHFKANVRESEVLHALHDAADFLKRLGITVMRRKIEMVIYDDRSSTVRFECKGGCPECHLDEQ